MAGPAADRLADAPPGYLAWLYRGVALQFWLIVAAVPAGLVMFLLARSSSLDAPQKLIAFELVGPLGGLAYLASIWMLTTPDPRRDEDVDHDRIRRLLRGLSVSAAVGMVVSLAARHWADLHGAFVVGPLLVLKAAVLGLLFLRCAHLAQKVDDTRMIRGARALAIGMPTCYLISCVTLMLMPTLVHAGAPSLASLIPLMSVVALTMLCQLLGWTAALLLAFKLARDLRTARAALAARVVP